MCCVWLSLTVGACEVKCNSECTKRRVWMAGRGNKYNRTCSVPGQLEVAMPSAEFTSCPSIREQTYPLLRSSSNGVRSSLRLCVVTLDHVLT